MGKLFYYYDQYREDILSSLTEVVAARIEEERPSRGQSKEQVAKVRAKELRVIQQMLAALYQAYTTILFGSDSVVVPLTNGHYSGNKAYPYTVVKRVFDALNQLGWITIRTGTEAAGAFTRIKATGVLENEFSALGLRWMPQTPKPRESLIVVKDFKNPKGKSKETRGSKIIPTPTTAEVHDWQDNLYRYNEFLCKQCISLDLTDEQLFEVTAGGTQEKTYITETEKNKKSQQSIDFSNVQLYRVFSRGSLSKGGRFYGGWWQQLPSRYRGHIRMNGLKTQEIDYSYIHLSCLYLQSGIEVDLASDLYNVGFDDWAGKTDYRRKPIKRFLNALLNDEWATYRLGRKDSQTLGLTHSELLDLVLKRHPVVAACIGTSKGLELQFLDSQIAEQVMMTMMAKGQLVLPIHDSFIVRVGYVHELQQAMQDAFQAHVGGIVNMTRDLIKTSAVFDWSESDWLEASRHEGSTIITPLEALKRAEIEGNSLMNGYLQTWMSTK